MINKKVGKEILRFLLSQREIQVRAVFIEDTKDILDEDLMMLFKQQDIITYEKDKYKSVGFDKSIFRSVDFLITVYWPYLIANEIILEVKDTINFHPSLLPHNRGWYPHCHNIINRTQPGVSLHRLCEKVDRGDIFCQKEVDIFSFDTAKDLHERLMDAMIEIFKENWREIAQGKVKPIPQENHIGDYYSKHHFEKLDKIDLEQTVKIGDFLNFLRARSYGDRGFSFFVDNLGNEIEVNIKLNMKANTGV